MAHEILDGIRVIDMTAFQLGPVNTLMLALMGAEVIKLEIPVGEPGRDAQRAGERIVKGGQGKGFGGLDLCAYFEANNHCKKSLVLDLTKPKAREVLYQLTAKSDVFAENMRLGVAARLGCDYQTLKKYNPKLIYYSGTSFGTKGPDGTKAGMDGSGRARSGWMYFHGEGEDPLGFMGGCSDQIGAIFGSYAILAALLARERHGIGQECETSHLAASMWLMQCSIQTQIYRGTYAYPVASREKNTGFLSGWDRCKDNNWLILISPTPRTWEPFCEALGIPPSIYRDDPRYNTVRARREHTEECVKMWDEAFAKKTRDEWIEIFNKNPKDLIWERVQKWEDLPNDPQVIANEYMSNYTHPLTGLTYKHVNLPVKFSETPAMKLGRAPLLGEHTEEILVNILGYKKGDVPKLLDEIGRPTVQKPLD